MWRKVPLPLIKPGISAVAILSFMSGWGEWLLAYTFLKDPSIYTLPVLITSMVYEFRFVNWGLLAAVSLFYISTYTNYVRTHAEGTTEDTVSEY